MNKVKVMNSQIDFCKPLRKQLTVVSKADNKILDNSTTTTKHHPTQQQITAREKTKRIKEQHPNRHPKTGKRRINNNQNTTPQDNRTTTEQENTTQNNSLEFEPGMSSTPVKSTSLVVSNSKPKKILTIREPEQLRD